MSLNESIVEDAALEWFLLRSAPLNYGGQVGELGYAVGPGAAFGKLRRAKPSLAPGEPAAERDSFSEVVLMGRLREAIRRLNPALSEPVFSTRMPNPL
jgi:type I restriction enzyme R subunit